ncbi:MAG TPA: lipid A deacylase LpxR family protein, partial [Rhodopila sp.]
MLTNRDFRHHVSGIPSASPTKSAGFMKFWIAAFVALLTIPGVAARAQPAAADPSSIWTLQDENASISAGTPTDRFYVNGLRLGWTSPTGTVPDFLADLGHTLWGDGQQRVAVDLSQQIYTPADTAAVVPSPFDRPYAGVLLGNFSLMSDGDDNTRSVLTLSLGLVGPWSGAENLQNGFHSLIGQNKTNGWGSQIQNVPAIDVLHERTWRLPLGTVAGMETDALPSLTIALGDLRDYVQTGVTFRLGQGLQSDFGVPRLRPGLSGSDAFTPTRPFA